MSSSSPRYSAAASGSAARGTTRMSGSAVRNQTPMSPSAASAKAARTISASASAIPYAGRPAASRASEWRRKSRIWMIAPSLTVHTLP